MVQKVFATHRDLKLISDERDIMVPARDWKAVIEWCRDNDIKVELSMGSTQSTYSAYTFGVYLWRVKDERQRVAFALRWQ